MSPSATDSIDSDYLLLKLEANGVDQRGEVVHARKAARNFGDHQLTPVGSVSVPIEQDHETLRTLVEGFSKPHLCIWASWYS